MIINLTRDGGTLMVALDGELDTITAKELEGNLHSAVDHDVTELVFDLEKLEYISSAGLRVLLAAQKVMNRQGSMTVRNVPTDIMDTFEITGFDLLLNIEES